MNSIFLWYPCVLFGVAGLHVIVIAASELGSPPLLSNANLLVPTTTSLFAARHPTNIPTTPSPRILAFTTSQTIHLNQHSGPVSGRPKFLSLKRSIPSSRRNSFTPRSHHRSHSTSTRVFMLSPENRELFSTVASLSFWPGINYINEAITWILGLSLMFLGAAWLVPKPSDERGQQQFAIVTTGVDVNVVNENNNDDALLTPGTYADSNSAERLVTDTVVAKASEAFDSTDFENEPHLSPELEDIEAAFEVALLADAAHAMADAAEKENRQSKAAMLEREKELEWIESQDEGESNRAMIGSSCRNEQFQRSLLAAQLALKSCERAKKKKEAFQRSLLSSRIALEIKSRESILEQQRNMEAMAIECDSDSVKSVDDLQLSVESVALSEAGCEEINETVVEKDGGKVTDWDSLLEYSQISEKGIQEEETVDDIVKNGSTQPSSQVNTILFQDQWKVENEPIQVETSDDLMKDDSTLLVAQAGTFSAKDQWRKDSVHAVRKYIHQKAIEKTKKKMMLKNNIDDVTIVTANSVDTINIVDEDQSEDIVALEIISESDSVMKPFHKRLHIRRMPRRRRLLVVALGLVITRRLFLAYFGKALSIV